MRWWPNAQAADAGREPPYSESDLMELRSEVHMAGLRAKEAACNIDDLGEPNVRDCDSSL